MDALATLLRRANAGSISLAQAKGPCRRAQAARVRGVREDGKLTGSGDPEFTRIVAVPQDCPGCGIVQFPAVDQVFRFFDGWGNPTSFFSAEFILNWGDYGQSGCECSSIPPWGEPSAFADELLDTHLKIDCPCGVQGCTCPGWASAHWFTWSDNGLAIRTIENSWDDGCFSFEARSVSTGPWWW